MSLAGRTVASAPTRDTAPGHGVCNRATQSITFADDVTRDWLEGHLPPGAHRLPYSLRWRLSEE